MVESPQHWVYNKPAYEPTPDWLRRISQSVYSGTGKSLSLEIPKDERVLTILLDQLGFLLQEHGEVAQRKQWEHAYETARTSKWSNVPQEEIVKLLRILHAILYPTLSEE